MQGILGKRDPSGGWRVFVGVFMFTTFLMLGFVSWNISSAYQDGRASISVVCQAIDIALDDDDRRPIECEEYIRP